MKTGEEKEVKMQKFGTAASALKRKETKNDQYYPKKNSIYALIIFSCTEIVGMDWIKIVLFLLIICSYTSEFGTTQQFSPPLFSALLSFFLGCR